MTRRKLTNEEYDLLLLDRGSFLFRLDDYINNKTKIRHSCEKDHITLISPSELLKRQSGCSYCLGTRYNKETLEERLKDKNYGIKVLDFVTRSKGFSTFLCEKCDNIWDSRIDRVVAGHGCPNCALKGFKTGIQGSLYYIKVSTFNENYYKIGVTNDTLKNRFRLDKDKEIKVLLWKTYPKGKTALKVEQFLLKKFNHKRITITGFLRNGGNTELFEEDVLNLEGRLQNEI